MTGQTLHLIVSLDTDRILWFGDSPPKGVDSEAVQATYHGPFPEGMTATNCNQYRLVNKQIIPPPAGQRKVSLLDENRDTIRAQINALIAAKVQPYLASTPIAEMTRMYKLQEARAFFDGTLSDSVFLPHVATQLGLPTIRQAAAEILDRQRALLRMLIVAEQVRVEAALGVAAAKSLNDLHAVKRLCMEQLES